MSAPRTQGFQVCAFDEPLPQVRPGDHLEIGTVGSGHDLAAVLFYKVNQVLVEDLVVPGIKVPEDGHLGTQRSAVPARGPDGTQKVRDASDGVLLGDFPQKGPLQQLHSFLDGGIRRSLDVFIRPDLAPDLPNQSPQHVGEIGVDGQPKRDFGKGDRTRVDPRLLEAVAVLGPRHSG